MISKTLFYFKNVVDCFQSNCKYTTYFLTARLFVMFFQKVLILQWIYCGFHIPLINNLYLCGIKSKKIMAEDITIIPNQTELEAQFAFVNSVIERYRSSAISMVNTAALQMYWEISQYISLQLKSSRWELKL